MANTLQDSTARQRRNNGMLEIKGPNGARVVALDELNQDDAELAVNFGYNPVLKRVNIPPYGMSASDEQETLTSGRNLASWPPFLLPSASVACSQPLQPPSFIRSPQEGAPVLSGRGPSPEQAVCVLL